MRLIKAQQDKKNDHEVVELFNKNKARKPSLGKDLDGKSQFGKEEKSSGRS